MKKIILWILGGILAVVLALGIYVSPIVGKMLSMTTVDLDSNMRIMLGGGGNSAILKSPDNKQVLIVDTKIAMGAKAIKRYVDSLGPDVQTIIVNTHPHPDHAGGIPLFPKARLIAGAYPDGTWPKAAGPRQPDELIPAGEEKTIILGDETIKIYNAGQAHSYNDVTVYFVNRQLLCTGDLVAHRWVPVVIKAGGAHVGKWIKALDYLAATYPAKQVMPGHGDMTDRNGILEQAEYFKDITKAAGNPKQLAALEKKYKEYLTLWGMSRVNDAAKAVAEEKQ